MIKRYIAITTLTLSFALMLFAGMQLSETRSAPNPGTQSYNTTLATSSLEVEAVDENGATVTELLDDYKSLNTLEIGKNYGEYVAAKNTGRADEYVRVIIRKYWTDQNGEKVRVVDKKSENDTVTETEAIDPGYIVLSGKDASWLYDANESTKETSVYYYQNKLSAGQITAPVLTGVSISKNVLNHYEEKVTKNGNESTIKVTYIYDDLKLNLDIDIQSVQANQEAIKSIWGVDYVSIVNDKLVIAKQGGAHE